MTHTRCKYCQKEDIITDECDCSNAEARKRFDQLKQNGSENLIDSFLGSMIILTDSIFNGSSIYD